MKKAKKSGWKVDYVPWDSKKKLIRHFPTEPKARAFYKKLLRRENPPSTQGISKDAE